MILAIDTSNYTTSAALMDDEKNLEADKREVLAVEKGKKGLRQSKAVFQHINKLPEVIDSLAGDKDIELSKIAVSTRPCPREDSYMPVFRVGEGQARSIARLLSLSLVEVSHQEGHLMAGRWDTGLEAENFLAFQLSGGTTQLLEVKKAEARPGFEIDLVGASQDLKAGQFIDRVGVKMGLSFPAGSGLEKLAENGKPGAVEVPFSVQGCQISFSGPCSAAERLIDQGESEADIALAVQRSIAKSLQEVLEKAGTERGLTDILFVGGVSANQYIRDFLQERLDADLYFPAPKFCTDNAVGVAALGVEAIR